MKIRNGFVSNSSSSSFIVAFDKDPQSANELMMMMFEPDMKCGADGISGCSFKQIAKTVYSDIEEQRKSKEIFFNPMILLCIEMGGDIDKIMDKFFPEVKNNWDEECIIRDKLEALQSNDYFFEFREKNKDKFIYKFSYADDCGNYESILEHGDIFNNLNHERESHH